MIHETSTIDPNVTIGENTNIWHYCHVMSGATIGKNCTIGQGCSIAGKSVIGNGCKIQNSVNLFDGIILEDDVFCGPNVTFTNVKTPRAFVNRRDEWLYTRICRGASIGAGCTIVCGITIGEYAMIGAGSVVTKDVEPYTLVYGNPAKMRGKVNKDGAILRP